MALKKREMTKFPLDFENSFLFLFIQIAPLNEEN